MQSEQLRQLRRERKRLRREEKRRSCRSPPGGTGITVRVLPPMGETLLEYAQPLILDLLPAEYGPQGLQPVLWLAALFWNSVLEEEEVEEAVPVMARRLVAKLQMPLTTAYRLSDALLLRRVRLFGDDPRIASNVEVSHDGDRLRVTARSTVLDEDAARFRFEESPVRP